MESHSNHSSKSLPPLPAECPELRPTADPDRDQPLEAHYDALPAVNRVTVARLNEIASVDEPRDAGPVLGLSDLLRRRWDGSHALHPRVIQVLSPADVDPVLARITECVDEYIDYAAYQYPEYLVECRDGPREGSILCPGDYSIDMVDVVRDLRANHLLTSIRPREQSIHDRTVLDEAVAQMERQGNTIEGVVTLWEATEDGGANQPALVIEDRGSVLGRQPRDELVDLCETIRWRFNALVSMYLFSVVPS